MPTITFDQFDGGLDRRKGPSAAGANQLRELTNAYVTRGKEVRRRPGKSLHLNLQNGSVGLFGLLGKLATFSGNLDVDHLSSLVENYQLPHPTNSARTLSRVWVADVFRGYIYASAEYDDGSVYHHYLDDPGAWVASTNYAIGNIVRPTVPNGYRYEATADTGSAGGSEPAWPTTVGATVVDSGITWTCRSFVVTDTNCPHSKYWAKIGDKIFAADGEDLTYCATGDARDWTAASDAGFKAVGSMTSGTSTVVTVAAYQKDIAVFFADAVQIWSYDADPALITLKQTIYNVGTLFPRSPIQMANNTFFLSASGFRSIAVAQQVDVLEDVDIGAPIDDIVKAEIVSTDNPFSVFFPALGQFWMFRGQDAYTYAFSKTSKVSAWGKVRFSVNTDAACQLAGQLYLRCGESVYVMSEMHYTDDGEAFVATVELPFQNAKNPGRLKMLTGVDAIAEGTFDLSLRYDPRDTSLITQAVSLSGDTTPGTMTPVEICATAFAPVITHARDEKFVLSALTFYYNVLGPM